MTALSVLAVRGEAPDAVALVVGDERLTYGALAKQVQARIAGLHALGLTSGSAAAGARLGVVGRPDVETVITVLAAIELGLALVLVHPRWTARERERAIALTRPVHVLDALHPTAAARDAAVWPPVPSERALALVFTSGTCGEPKPAVLSRRAFLAAAHASAEVLGWRDDDVWLCAMPLAHVGGLSIVVRALVARRAIALGSPGTFDPARFIDTLTCTRTTIVSLVPTMLAKIVDADLRAPAALRVALVGGAACPPRVLAAAAALGWHVRTTYGLTEACAQVATARDDVVDARAGSGMSLPGVEIVIENEHILVRSPAAMDGYLRDDGTLERPFDARGFYDTGDDGRIDEKGRLHVLGRRTDLIVTGGENVRPADVEAALESISGIRAACVFGIPDERWGAIVVAAIELEPGAPGPTDDEIEVALRARLAPFKLPRRLVRVPLLATGPSGKLDRARTRDAALGRRAG